MADSKLNTGIICCDIDHLDRIVRNFSKLEPTIPRESDGVWYGCKDSWIEELIADLASVRDQVEYFKEVNRDTPRIPKTF